MLYLHLDDAFVGLGTSATGVVEGMAIHLHRRPIAVRRYRMCRELD